MATSIPLDDLDTTLALARADDWRRYDNAAGHANPFDRVTDEPPPGMSSAGLVARHRELASLDRALRVARRGRSEVMVLRGEPGTGKSSLVQAAIGRARDVRNIALRGTLYFDGVLPSGSWPQPIVDILDVYSSPEPDVGPGTPVVSAMVDALVNLAGQSLAPLLLSVDDCHLLPDWFIAALVEAVGTQLKTMPIVLVLSASSLAGTQMASDAELGVSSYQLRPLTVRQAKLLLDLRGDRMPIPRVLLELVQSTAGNPQALLDVGNALDSDELAGHRPLPDPLPLSAPLVAKFARRFRGLPEATRRALSVVSAGHVPFDTLTRTLTDLGMAEGTLKPAQEAGMLVLSRDRIEFGHPIERSAVYWLSSAEDRSRAHEALSRALLDQDRVELGAFHASRGKTSVDNGLARLHFEAARMAIDGGSPAAAARHHEMAAAFAESSEASAHHLVLAASLLLTIGRIDRALSHLDRAVQKDPSDHLQGQAAYLEARARLANDLDPEIADEMIAAADLCEGDANDWAVLMLVDAAACLLITGSPSEAVAVATRARDLGRAVGAHQEALATATLAVSASRAGLMDSDRPDLAASSGQLVAHTDQFQASPQLAWFIAIRLLEQGDPTSARAWAEWIERCADRAGDRPLSVVPPAVRGMMALHNGELDAAVVFAQTAVDRASGCGDQTLTAQALGLLTGACSARGLYARGFAAGAQGFTLSDDTARIPRIQTLVALAGLELQKNRTASAYAWLRAANDEFATDDDEAVIPADHYVSIHWSLAYAELSVLSRCAEDLAPLARAVETAERHSAPSAWLMWIQALSTPDFAAASGYFEQADALVAGVPFAQARLRMCWGARLADWGHHDEARDHLDRARAWFSSLRADGWVHVIERELEALPQRHVEVMVDGSATDAHVPDEAGADPVPAEPPAVDSSGRPRWEISLLGEFCVRQEGRPVSLPNSLAVQALKIVTLRKRISVDELVELLWPDAHPGVGNRRLRNVLWRSRVSCGDLLYRDGNFICLSKEAAVDADLFRVAADRAIEAAAADDAPDLVREALSRYPGELLPGDHYVDWATARRESLAGLYMSLLDLLLDQSIAEGQTHEALGFLDRLIEADPYEERHYVRAAELHAAAGNVSRALSTLSRADRTLTDLGLGPSPIVAEVRQKLAS